MSLVSFAPSVAAPQPVGPRVAHVNPPPFLARAGEVVTRESGETIATVARDIRHGELIGPDAFKGWTIEPPRIGVALPRDPVGQRWVRLWRRGVDIHLARGWAMETKA